MNPSSSLWVKKFGVLFESKTAYYHDFESLYSDLIDIGFVFGLHFKTVDQYTTKHELLADEIAKLNLVFALSEIHATLNKTRDFKCFLDDVLRFYKPLSKSSSIWKTMLSKEPSVTLEALIDRRINTKNNRLTQLFSSDFYNAFVLFDVISFYHFLRFKTDYDDSYGYLKELTLHYGKKTLFQIPESKHQLFGIFIAHLGADHLFETYDADSIAADTYWYHRYILDFCSILIYAQDQPSESHNNYLSILNTELNLEATTIELSKEKAVAFTSKFKTKLDSLKASNTINRFQAKITSLAERLIKRNSKRILTELSNSKELVVLLTYSTHRELNPEEQKKVQQYALDIAKSIPSIAIFMLPGGALLLPIFIRLIPKLLPSAFDENRID